MVDGDLEGATAAFAEAGRALNEIGSRDDESQMRLRLAEIAARRGDLAAASEFYEAAWAAAESDGTPGDVAIVSAGPRCCRSRWVTSSWRGPGTRPRSTGWSCSVPGIPSVTTWPPWSRYRAC
jgi:hypothetical protein